MLPSSAAAKSAVGNGFVNPEVAGRADAQATSSRPAMRAAEEGEEEEAEGEGCEDECATERDRDDVRRQQVFTDDVTSRRSGRKISHSTPGLPVPRALLDLLLRAGDEPPGEALEVTQPLSEREHVLVFYA